MTQRIFDQGAPASGSLVTMTDPATEKSVSATVAQMLGALTGSETFDAASIDDGNEVANEVTVTGAALGDFAFASMGVDVADLVLAAEVTAADTVTVVLANNTGGAIDLASTTLRCVVIPKATFGF
jgi:hypothetical protein